MTTPAVIPQYDKLSTGLTVALVMFPMFAIFFALRGNYSPRTKLVWSIIAALETAWTVFQLIATILELRSVLG